MARTEPGVPVTWELFSGAQRGLPLPYALFFYIQKGRAELSCILHDAWHAIYMRCDLYGKWLAQVYSYTSVSMRALFYVTFASTRCW